MPPKLSGERAYWSKADETRLLEFLNDHKSEAGDGMNFKAPTWVTAAAYVNQAAFRGALKTPNSCKAKYRAVSVLWLVFCIFFSD